MSVFKEAIAPAAMVQQKGAKLSLTHPGSILATVHLYNFFLQMKRTTTGCWASGRPMENFYGAKPVVLGLKLPGSIFFLQGSNSKEGFFLITPLHVSIFHINSSF